VTAVDAPAMPASAGLQLDEPPAARAGQLHRGVRRPRVSVVIPALNEAANIAAVLTALDPDLFEVILVDGNSTDGTIARALAARPDLRVVRQTRHGKGNALACGFHACRGDIIAMLDADGSTDVREIPAFVEALQAGCHFAKGTRFDRGGGSDDITRLRAWGNTALNQLVNRLYETDYSDLCYGYNAFWSACLPFLGCSEPGYEIDPRSPAVATPRSSEVRWGDGFEIETLLTVRVSMLGMSVTEVGSYESCRVFGRSNLHAGRDGLRVLRTIARERRRLQPLLLSPPSLPRPWEDAAQWRSDSLERTALA